MSILGTVRKLVFPSLGSAMGAIPVPERSLTGLPYSLPASAREALTPKSPYQVSRRTFFSFFGVGAAMLAKPDLFVPKPQYGWRVLSIDGLSLANGKWIPIDEVLDAWGLVGKARCVTFSYEALK